MSEWISVMDKLPDFGQNVLTIGPKGSMETIYYRGLLHIRRDKWKWKYNGVKTITHWMPLPEPPKEGNP